MGEPGRAVRGLEGGRPRVSFARRWWTGRESGAAAGQARRRQARLFHPRRQALDDAGRLVGLLGLCRQATRQAVVRKSSICHSPETNVNRELIDQYEADGDLPAKAIAGLTRDELIARPIAGTWSVQEVVLHL